MKAIAFVLNVKQTRQAFLVVNTFLKRNANLCSMMMLFLRLFREIY